jgi:lauroyl/myristoyl acyltransferase
LTGIKRRLHGGFIEVCRGLARFLPPTVLHAALVPYEWLRGAWAATRYTELPLRHLGPGAEQVRPAFYERWRYQARNYERWLATTWPELWRKPPWSERLRVDNAEVIDALLADRPVVIATIHSGWQFSTASWLLNRGVEIGSVVAGAEAWQRTVALRGTRYWDRYAGVHVFPQGDARSMVRFLTPGRCFLIQVDYPQGDVIEVPWGGRLWPVATGAFRLARLATAAVVPVVALDDGLWRLRVHVGAPVPEQLIASGNDAASVSHVLNEIMPLVARVPDQLMGWRPIPEAPPLG